MSRKNLKRLKSRISYFIARNRYFPLFSAIARLSKSYIRVYENHNYKIESNGEQRVIQALGELPIKIVFDVGANIGEWSIAFDEVHPSAEIFSFEPIKSTYLALKNNTSGSSHIKTFNIGLSNKTERLVMYADLEKPVLSSLIKPANQSDNVEPEECVFETGDAFCSKHGITAIDFLKIDVEGAEGRVLEGFSDMLKAGKIRLIQFEYNAMSIQSKFLLYDFYQLLTPLGYYIGKIYPNSVEFRPYHTSMEDFIGLNYLAVHDSVAKEWIPKLKG